MRKFPTDPATAAPATCLAALLLASSALLGAGAPPAGAQDGTTLRLEQAAYEENEEKEVGIVPIRVIREGNLSGTSRVAYATSNGTATEGADYTGASGVLEFGPGESSAQFFILLGPEHIDNLIEPDETVNITLSNPEGATLAAPTAGVLTITDGRIRTSPRRLAYSYRGTSVTLNWTDDADNETGYQIQRKDGGGDFRTVGRVAANRTSFTEGGLREGRTYTYRVRAVRDDLSSEWSLPVTFTVGRSDDGGRFVLRISKREIPFGTVRVGRSAEKPLVIRNVGRRAVTVRVTGLEPPFAVVKGLDSGTDFTLEAGRRRKIRVRFTPTEAGRQTQRDVLRIGVVNRDDTVTGRGIPVYGRGKR